MKKIVGVLITLFILLSLPSISAIQYQEITQATQSKAQETIASLSQGMQASIEKISSLFKDNSVLENILGNNIDAFQSLKNNKGSLFQSFFKDFLDNGNISSFDLIMALLGTIAFFILTQPIFLQLIVEAGNDFIFIILVFSLIFIEVLQKFFALKVIGVWDQFIVEDIDGFWNFFSVVFFSIYFKIYLSYLPTFIIQYSTVLVKGVFYVLMFAIPILFNFFIADSMDLIDWNGDEWPEPTAS